MFFRSAIKRTALHVLGLVLAAAFFSLPLPAQQQTLIEDIVITGARKIPADTVRGRMFTRRGDVYDQAALERDFASIWNTGYYDDLRMEREESPKGFIIHIYLTEKPTIRSIEYPGLETVTTSDVLERFKKDKVGLSIENQYDPAKVKKAEVTIKALLAEHGRQFATIRTEVRKIPPAAVGIRFVVKEGPKVKVGKIRFEGNKNFSSRGLRAAMKNTKPIGIPHSIFLENLWSRTFDSSKLTEDTERVRDAYQQKGYFKVLVEDPKTQMKDTGRTWFIPWSKAGKSVDISVPIEEGDKFRLGSMVFTGNKAVADQRALRSLFAIRDGDIFNTELLRKGIESLKKAYGELGYINFTSVPKFDIDDDKKLIHLTIDVDEGKAYSVRRIEFQGNTTTRDKVIRREMLLEEGNTYNSRLWEISLLRLNQLQYFEPLRPEESSETHRNDVDGTVDLTLKVREKGKNSIGLQGGVSGLAGGFVGINYETNNFLGLGETLRVEFNIGSRQRNISFSFSEPYLWDRPLNLGFTVYTRRFDYNQLKESQILFNQQFNLPQGVLDTFQNYSQSSTGFGVSLSYPLRRSFKRIGISYAYDRSSITTFTSASRQLFQQIQFRNTGTSDPLKGIITSKVVPSFSMSNVGPNPQTPHMGKSIYFAADFSGLGGNVASIRPVAEYKQFFPMHGWKFRKDGVQTLGYRIQGSFITGYRGLSPNPSERYYIGGEQDIRGFDIRTVSPYVFLASRFDYLFLNPDDACIINTSFPCTGIPKDPTNPRRGQYTVPIPIQQITVPGGDTSIISNLEYRIPIVGPVAVAPFFDFGMSFITRPGQLKLNSQLIADLTTNPYGCPFLDATFNCGGGVPLNVDTRLHPINGTNFVPRASTGIELQVILPVVNAPIRIYYAYNPLILNTAVNSASPLTRSMFPAGSAGDFNYLRALQIYYPVYRLKEPRTTFRFTVATTF